MRLGHMISQAANMMLCPPASAGVLKLLDQHQDVQGTSFAQQLCKLLVPPVLMSEKPHRKAEQELSKHVGKLEDELHV